MTPAENNRRSTSPTAANLRKTHCVRGHEFTPENTQRPREDTSWRLCRTCRREKNTRKYYRHRETILARRRERYAAK